MRAERRERERQRRLDSLQASGVAAPRVQRDLHDLPEVPDISANAGVYETFYDAGWMAVGGTSIAAPKLAGIAADIAQGAKAGRLGDFAPELAALAAKHVYGTALTDIKTGINWTSLAIEDPGSTDLTRTHAGAFRTTSGFDVATGFGTPLAAGLACPQVSTMTPSHGQAARA